MKIKSFQGSAPLPSGIASNNTAGELTALWLGTALKLAHRSLIGKQFSFLLTSTFTHNQLRIGMACHIPRFYDSYKSLLSTFFLDINEFVTMIQSLPESPVYRGGIMLGSDVPYTVSIKEHEIEWTCLLQQHVCKLGFPASTSSVLGWLGCAANNCIMHYDDFGTVPLSNAETKLMERFLDAKNDNGILAIDELEVDESNPEVWHWASV
jgi:hypothetical protein